MAVHSWNIHRLTLAIVTVISIILSFMSLPGEHGYSAMSQVSREYSETPITDMFGKGSEIREGYSESLRDVVRMGKTYVDTHSKTMMSDVPLTSGELIDSLSQQK